MRFHRFWAVCINLNTIAKVVSLDPQPRLFFVLSRTVAKVDSIGLVVRR